MFKIAKKSVAVIVCFAVILSLCACSGGKSVMDTISNLGKSKDVEPIDEIGFTVPYMRTDSLDPYRAVNSMNKYVSRLIYDSLFTVDNTFKESAVIAESATVSDTTLTVKIKNNIKFTDSSPLTSKDIVYSFNRAKDSVSYAGYLENISDAAADGTYSVVFTLISPNKSEAANLIFPIVKDGSYTEKEVTTVPSEDGEEEETTASSASGYTAKIPVGSGRYTFISNGESKYLQYNKNRLGKYMPTYAKIGLVDISASESFSSLYDLNKIDFYADNFDSGKYTKFTKVSGNVELTDFVYIGINSDSGALAEPRVRRAIALALDRTELASVSFAGCAVATALPFHPSYGKLKGCALPTLDIKKENAVSLLESVGYSEINDSGARYNNDKVMNFTLLVNSENDFRRSLARGIQQALESINIKITIKEVSYSDYVSAITGESFDMYIGETELSNSFGLSRFFSEKGGLRYGISEKNKTSAVYGKYLSGQANLQALIGSFSDEMPFIPLAFRQGITVSSEKIKSEIKTVPGDCFANIDEWTAQ